MSKPIVINKVSGSNSDQSQEHTNGDLKRRGTGGLTKDSSGEDDGRSPTRSKDSNGFSSHTLINAKLDIIQGRTIPDNTHVKAVVPHMFDTIVESKDPT
jgi:hypothetical protein